jgi:hypothetical protein
MLVGRGGSSAASRIAPAPPVLIYDDIDVGRGVHLHVEVPGLPIVLAVTYGGPKVEPPLQLRTDVRYLRLASHPPYTHMPRRSHSGCRPPVVIRPERGAKCVAPGQAFISYVGARLGAVQLVTSRLCRPAPNRPAASRTPRRVGAARQSQICTPPRFSPRSQHGRSSGPQPSQSWLTQTHRRGALAESQATDLPSQGTFCSPQGVA